MMISIGCGSYFKRMFYHTCVKTRFVAQVSKNNQDLYTSIPNLCTVLYFMRNLVDIILYYIQAWFIHVVSKHNLLIDLLNV